MKTELSLEGFSEISQSRQQEINGGLLPFVAGILSSIVVAAVTEIIDDWDNFKNGLKGLPEQK
jgi:hypothetical protein